MSTKTPNHRSFHVHAAYVLISRAILEAKATGIEKDALEEAIRKACIEADIPFWRKEV